jgi:N2-citryl-N6-acetyl-N6-hydroxylysine synthase
MRSIQDAAERLSLSCFLNSFLREQAEITPEELPLLVQEDTKVRSGLRIGLEQHPEYSAIWLPLRRYSRVGRHRYAWPLYGVDHRQHVGALDLMSLAGILLYEENILGKIEPVQRLAFLQRLRESRDMIAESLSSRALDIHASYSRELNFLEAEQLLIAGHSFHPTPKSRDEFTAADRSVYSPEMGGQFPLAWVLADARYVQDQQSEHFQRDWIQELISSDPDLALEVPDGMRVLPLHPWQAERLKQHPALQKAQERGDIRFLEPRGSLWYPTSSLRSLYRPGAPYMLKFSLSLRLTNSVRHLLLHEVERGLQVYDVLASETGRDFLRRQPLHVLREPAFAMLLGEYGEPLHETLIVCRENPIQNSDPSQPLVLATLTQEDPLGSDNRIVRHIKAWAARESTELRESARLWLRRFCKVALEPFLVAQSDYGILLGAHQQNMLLSIKDDLPERVYFRDCQGTGYSEWAYPKLAEQARLDSKNGNILPPSMEAALFIYYLIINSCFNVIAAVADSEAIEEDELLQEVQELLYELLRRKPRDAHILQDILRKDRLMYKGNFLCSLRGINENTSANPLKLYVPIRNPLAPPAVRGHRIPIRYEAPESSFAVVIRAEGSMISAVRGDMVLMQFQFEDAQLTVVRDYLGPEREMIHLRVVEFIFGHEPAVHDIDCSQMVAAWPEAFAKAFVQERNSGRFLDRESFFQFSPLWHRRQESPGLVPERWTQTQGRAHPERPCMKAGVLYRRHLPRTGRTISFELFDREKHLDVFHGWHNQPRVAQFWEMAESRDKLDAYIQKMEKDPHQRPMIAMLDDLPIGYFEVYWTPEDRLGPYYDYDPFDRGFHFLIGDVSALGRKGTPEIIQSMVHFIFLDDARTRRVMGEPRHDNIKLLRYLSSIPGWAKIKEFDFPHKRAALLQIKREDFFLGGGF